MGKKAVAMPTKKATPSKADQVERAEPHAKDGASGGDP